jgi:hypothetical protein
VLSNVNAYSAVSPHRNTYIFREIGKRQSKHLAIQISYSVPLIEGNTRYRIEDLKLRLARFSAGMAASIDQPTENRAGPGSTDGGWRPTPSTALKSIERTPQTLNALSTSGLHNRYCNALELRFAVRSNHL